MLMITLKGHSLGLTPNYSTDLLTPYEPDCSQRPAGRGLFSIPRSRLQTRRSRQASSVPALESLLKIKCFKIAPSSSFISHIIHVFYCV